MNEIDITKVNDDVIREVLWHFSHPQGWRPGSFHETLLEAMGRADYENFSKLRKAFPDYGDCMYLAMHEVDGISTLVTTLEGCTATISKGESNE